MLRCKTCGGRAHPALAHLHGMTDPYCYDCTQRMLLKRQDEKNIEKFLDAWRQEINRNGNGQKAA